MNQRRQNAADDATDMRQRILSSATHLFARGGVGNTSLSRIADEVGIRKASLLYHFASKDALHQAVLDSLVARWNERLPSLMLAASTGEGRFEAIVWEVVNFFSEDADRARLLVREMLDRPDVFREVVRVHLSGWMDVVDAALRAGQREGVIRADLEPRSAVMQAMHLLVGGLASYDVLGVFDASDDDAFERYVTQLIRFTHAGIFLDAEATDD